MSGDPKTATPDEAQGRFTLLEARFFQLSPFGLWPTLVLVFAGSFGSALLIAHLTQQPPILDEIGDSGTYQFQPVLWVCLVLSLILTAALGLAETGRRMWAREGESLVLALKPEGAAAARALGDGAPVRWRGRYTGFLVGGMIAGIGVNGVIMWAMGAEPVRYLSSIGLWFFLASSPLYAMGLRAGVDLSRESGELRALTRDHLDVDLLHLERLQVFGRIGLRGALSWMIMAAIMLLFVLDPSAGATSEVNAVATLIALPLAGLGGTVIFASAVNPVRKAVQEAKRAEIATIRVRISEERTRLLADDTTGSGKLAELLAYQDWIDKRPEWPISAPVTTRFGLYVLIPAIPWFGAALADRLISSV
jgi:hypothetical protein